ncbi:MAG: hypothetical protein ACREX9_20595, partial [Gammaproteobacteria bacterium]
VLTQEISKSYIYDVTFTHRPPMSLARVWIRGIRLLAFELLSPNFAFDYSPGFQHSRALR